MRTVLIFSLAAAALLSACAAATPLPPEPTQTPPPPSATATPTVVWFPATATPSPFPTPVITPTLDLRPEAGGALLLRDDFSDPDPWTLSQSRAASAALGVNELTLALHQPGGYLYSLRSEPLLGDFYLEITASPNLCKDGDEYGLLLRVTSSLEFYRFSLSCAGQARLDKYFNGTASSPQPPIYSGAVPPGAPSASRLAVLAKGREMQFFANDQYLFTVSDPSIPSGSLGVFARSAGEDDLTVSFSDLVIQEAGD